MGRKTLAPAVTRDKEKKKKTDDARAGKPATLLAKGMNV